FDGGTLKTIANTTVATTTAIAVRESGATIDVPEGQTLTLKAELTGTGTVTKTGAGTLVLEKLATTSAATIHCAEGAIDLLDGRNASAVTFDEGTTLMARETTSDDGTLRINGINGNPVLAISNAVGTLFDAEAIERGEGYVQVTFTPTVSGKGCWMDYEFDGNLSNVGTDTIGLSRDGSDFGDDASSDFKTDEGGNAYALYAGTHPYRDVTYPTEWSCAIYCSVPDYPKAALITFGTKDGGLIGLIAGTEKDQVFLVRTNGDEPYEILATMAVPNAATAQHLYVFTKTVREIKVYLDGKLWTTYTSATDINFGGGMQIASVYGNVGSTGIVRFDKALFADDADNTTLRKSLIGMMRLYNAVLGPNAAAALSEEFPYVSPNGLFTRDVTSSGTWSQTDAWTKVQESGDAVASIPEDGATVKLTASGEATVEVNLASAMKTEELVIDGSAALTFTRPQAGKVANSGATTINTAVTIANQALDLAGGPLTLGANGSICFDLTDYPFGSVLEPTVVALTGMTANQGEKVTSIHPDSLTKGRLADVVYDTASQTYQLKIGFAREPGEVYLPETAITDGAATIMNDTDYVDANGDETLLYSNNDWIVIDQELTLTIGENLSRPAKIKVVDGGVLKLNFASDVTQSGYAYNATVRVEEGGVYDLANADGHKDYSHPIVLAGGTLTNSGIATTVASRQYWQMSVEKDSKIDVSGNEFGAVNSGHNAHNYNLNGYTLVKTGAGQFTFKTANFVGGGTIRVDAGKVILSGCTVPSGTTLNFVIAEGAEVEIDNGTTFGKPGSVTGAGMITYTAGISPEPIFQDEGWQGTVWLKNMTWNNANLGREGNMSTGAKLRLTSFVGYPDNDGSNAEIELHDEGLLPAMSVTNAADRAAAYQIRKLSGSGTFSWLMDEESSAIDGRIYWLKNIDDYTGKLVTGDYLQFMIGGTSAGDLTPGAIKVADGLTIYPANWSAKSITFGETLKVKGVKGDVIATVANEPTFGKVKVTLVDGDGNETSGYALMTRAIEGGYEVFVSLSSFTISIR
ncbi:MAG: hypothetical protein ACI4TC_01390, partial [Kiritimatiellia bacterium]